MSRAGMKTLVEQFEAHIAQSPFHRPESGYVEITLMNKESKEMVITVHSTGAVFFMHTFLGDLSENSQKVTMEPVENPFSLDVAYARFIMCIKNN